MESIEKAKQYKQDKVLEKQKAKDLLRREKARIASSRKVSNLTKKVSQGVLIPKKKKYSDIFKEFETGIYNKNDDVFNIVWEHYKVKFKQRKYKNMGQLARLVFADYVLLHKSDDKGICSCVTCGKELHRSDPNMHPGHFRPAGSSLKYRFVMDNVRPQDYYCNVGLHGNYGKYTLFMIDTFGRERVDNILSDKSLFKIKDWEYIDMMKKWWSDVELLMKVKNLEKSLAI